MATQKQIDFFSRLMDEGQTSYKKAQELLAVQSNGFYPSISGLMIQQELTIYQGAKARILDVFSKMEIRNASALIDKKLAANKWLLEIIQRPETNATYLDSSVVNALGKLIPIEEENIPKPTVELKPKPLTEGMYLMDGVVYKVQKAVYGSFQLYAKALVQRGEKWKFEFSQGTVRKLTLDHKMSLEDGKKYGKLYGVCCVCGRVLTDENSIQAGIGPVCANKF